MQDFGALHLLIFILSPSFFDCSNRLCFRFVVDLFSACGCRVFFCGRRGGGGGGRVFSERFAVRLPSFQRGGEEEVADCENFEGVMGVGNRGVCVWNSSRGLWCGEQVGSMEEL